MIKNCFFPNLPPPPGKSQAALTGPDVLMDLSAIGRSLSRPGIDLACSRASPAQGPLIIPRKFLAGTLFVLRVNPESEKYVQQPHPPPPSPPNFLPVSPMNQTPPGFSPLAFASLKPQIPILHSVFPSQTDPLSGEEFPPPLRVFSFFPGVDFFFSSYLRLLPPSPFFPCSFPHHPSFISTNFF